jgi:hypothetical protein
MSAKNNKNSRNNRSRHKNYIVAASIYVITKLSSCYIAEISTSSISKINVE